MAEIEIPQPNITQSESSLVRKTGSKPQPKRPEKTGKTIKGKAVKRELTFKEKLKRSFVKEDIKNVGDYIIFDILIPGAKKAFLDIVIGTLSQTLGIPVRGVDFGNSRRPNGYSGSPDRPMRDYAAMSRSANRDRMSSSRSMRYDRFRVTDVVFEYKEDAMSLLEQMVDICDTYGWFSVFDFYDKAGITEGNDYTNNSYGWHDVSGAQVVFDGTGYIINLPQARMR